MRAAGRGRGPGDGPVKLARVLARVRSRSHAAEMTRANISGAARITTMLESEEREGHLSREQEADRIFRTGLEIFDGPRVDCVQLALPPFSHNTIIRPVEHPSRDSR